MLQAAADVAEVEAAAGVGGGRGKGREGRAVAVPLEEGSPARDVGMTHVLPGSDWGSSP